MPQVENVSLGAGQIANLQSVVQLSSADILALFTTPKVLIPAPGAGKLIVPLWQVAVVNPGTVPYVASAGDAFNVTYATTGDNPYGGSFTGLITKATPGFLLQSTFVGTAFALLPGDDNKALQITGTPNYNVGPIVTSTLGAGGTGYVANDTGTIATDSFDATYKVLTVGAGGAVLTYQITGAGTAYTTGNGKATATGGAQPGVGINFTVNVTAVNHGNGTLKVVTYYQIIPVP